MTWHNGGWKNGGNSGSSSNVVGVNTYCYGSSSKFYLPMCGSSTEWTTKNQDRVFCPPGMKSGKLLNLTIFAGVGLGSTIFTLETFSTILGTKTQSVTVSTLSLVDFTTGLDSGVNTYDGADTLFIGIDPTGSYDLTCYVQFEMDS